MAAATIAAEGGDMTVVQSVENSGQWIRIRFAGDIDVATCDVIRETIDNALSDYPGATFLEIDVEAVPLIDSTGVGVLVVAHRQLAERGVRLFVTNPVKIVERVMKVTGVFDMLTGAASASPRRGSGSSSRRQ